VSDIYKCLNCAKEIKLDQLNERIRCPFCGYRIVVKARPKSPVTVPAK